MADHQERNQSCSLEELFERYVSQKDRTPKFREGFKQTLRCFNAQAIVSDLRSSDVETAFADKPDGSKRAHLMRLGAVLTYGVRKGVCKTDVSKAVDKPTLAKEEVVIATPEVVQELFADALANRRELIPFLTFTFFCGIRPEGEMSKLEWSNVLEDKVVLRGTQTKTGHKREIPLSENAKAWLSMYTGERTGKVVPSLHRINQLRKKNWKASSHKDKTQDVARHSFCSYYYQLVGDLTKAMDASGHEQPGVFYKHYREHVSAEACKRYWAIFPAA